MQSFSGHKTQKGALWSAAFAAQTVTPRTTPVRRCLRLSQMVRRVGLLLAYLVVPLGCLSPSEASAGEREEIGLASYYSRGQSLHQVRRSTKTRLLVPIGPYASAPVYV